MVVRVVVVVCVVVVCVWQGEVVVGPGGGWGVAIGDLETVCVWIRRIK